MSKKLRFTIKFIAFIAIFFVLCNIAAFFFCDDANAYTRVLMNEFHNQEKIDYIFCGASHVSHGLYPAKMDEEFGKSTFCTGTPSQGLDGTYAILKEAAKLYNLEKAFVELDFATARSTSFWDKKPSTSIFLVAHYLKVPSVKFEYILDSTSPKYYLNSLIPIGVEKLVELNPVVVAKKLKSRIDGSYYRYEYHDNTLTYAGKGCMFDSDFIENGTFSSEPVSPINVAGIGEEWKTYIQKIIELCKEKNIDLVFYSNPSTDFYLTEKGNYDEYISFLQEFLAQFGYDYYDFSLCRPEYFSLEDRHFSDDNHLNRDGIMTFTKFFCNFFNGKIQASKEEVFYKTYLQKQSEQPTRIYGLMLDENKDANTLKIIPVINHGDKDKITYTVYAETEKETIIIQENSKETLIKYPANTVGRIIIQSFYDGIQHNKITEHYSAL